MIRTPFGTIPPAQVRNSPPPPHRQPPPLKPPQRLRLTLLPTRRPPPPRPGKSLQTPPRTRPAEPAGDAPETVPDPAGGQPSPSPLAGDPTVGFNCVQCSLAEFVRSLAGELELNYLLDPGVQGTVNIHTYGRMRRSDLRSLLETVLEINGAAMVRQGAVYRILPSQNARQLPLQVRQGGGARGGAGAAGGAPELRAGGRNVRAAHSLPVFGRRHHLPPGLQLSDPFRHPRQPGQAAGADPDLRRRGLRRQAGAHPIPWSTAGPPAWPWSWQASSPEWPRPKPLPFAFFPSPG